MNKERREQLKGVSELLNDALDLLDEIRSEEQDAYDNLPDSLQDGSKGKSMQETVAMMDSWEIRVNDIINIIDNYSAGTITTDQANMTTYKRLDPLPVVQSCAISNHSITINTYNEKSLVIRGNTRDIKEKLKLFGAKFNRGLNGGSGWIISKKHENQFRMEFAKYI